MEMMSSGSAGRWGPPSLVAVLPLRWTVVGWLGRWIGVAVAALFRHPGLLAVIAAGSVGGVLLPNGSVELVLLSVFGLLSMLGLWFLLGRESFDWCVAWPLRSAQRKSRVYRMRWEPALVTADLSVTLDGVRYLPRLVRVRSTGSVDLVTVSLLTGQLIDDFARAAERLAQTFGARECRVRRDPHRSDRLVLWFLIRDPLAIPVPPFRPVDPPDLSGLPVASQENGMVYRLRLLGTHLLLVGATSAGKSSVVWAIIHALAPGISSGLVAVWVVDPKGGMELAAGQRLFARFCHGDIDDAAASHEIGYAILLEDAVAVMRTRQASLRGVIRLHQPAPDEPLIVLIIDELAALTSYVTYREAKRRIGSALSLLLSQGRAVGVTVVAALQDPRKEVLPARDLFPTRVGLRMVDADQVDMVLGAGARNRGARCDQVPESLPGVGYVGLDGVAEPVRVRFAYLADTDIQVMVDWYSPQLPAVTNDPDPAVEDHETVAAAGVARRGAA